jgi:hypothetical protein
VTRRRLFAAFVVTAVVVGAAVAAAVISSGSSTTASKGPRLDAPAGVKSASGATSSSRSSAVGSGPIVMRNLKHDVSPPLRTLKSLGKRGGKKAPEDNDEGMPPVVGSKTPDPVVQSQVGSGQIPSTIANFAGLAAGSAGLQYIPPDPNGTVGPSNFFEISNAEFAIYSKTGTKQYGPVTTNTLWSGFGGQCQSDDDGDGTVVYDQFANRWIVQQFAVDNTPFLECVAVSTTGDPTGTYNRYSFSYGTDFPDYPKLAVWPDGYYATYDVFANGGNNYIGPEACALDRSSMIAGAAATQQCFKTNNSQQNPMLPATVEGSTPPPSGSPDYILSSTTGALQEWKFHVDWVTPGNSTFTGPAAISVAAYSQACGGGACIPQTATTVKLDSLGDRLMYPLGYRNFGDHESLVVDQSVTAGSSVGMRWYEIRTPGTAPTVFQQGTYAPDGAYRWMGSVAMDHVGDMAMGFSISSSTTHPGIRYTGRLVGDALGTMGQGEGTVITGNGSQNNSNDCQPSCAFRWGDYTSMQVDPSDDCTFWYTNEYIPQNGEFNWQTQIASFKFPSCTGGGGGGAPVVSSFNPTQGPVGTSVDVLGSGFTGVTAVKFNGTAASFTFNSDSELHATVPNGATTGPISVTTPSGTGTSSTSFNVTTGGGGNPPTVSSFTPTSGPVGTNVSITGANFTGATSVTFNGTAATNFTVNSDTSINANVPSGATTGKIAVTTGNGTGMSSTNFTVTTGGGGKPTITGFSPTSGYPGAKVTITGTNLSGVTQVQLGSAAATFTVNSSTSITATVPHEGFLGSYRWTVRAPGGASTSLTYFRYL